MKLERVPEEVLALLRFGGFSNDENIVEHSMELLEKVNVAGLKPIGPVRFLGYDPPWQLLARRNEVVVAVEWTM